MNPLDPHAASGCMMDVYPAGTEITRKRGVSMGKERWQIGEMARMAGVSIRTLHHYDAIGLLAPSDETEAGYRIYDGAAMARLEQILYFRELGFPLEEIREMMADPHFDAREAMIRQKALLEMRRNRIDAMLKRLEEAIAGRGAPNMEVFDMSEIEKMKTICLEAMKAFDNDMRSFNIEALTEIAQVEQRLDDLTDAYRKAQIERMKTTSCAPEASVFYSEMLTDVERIGDHLLNIAEQFAQMYSGK